MCNMSHNAQQYINTEFLMEWPVFLRIRTRIVEVAVECGSGVIRGVKRLHQKSEA